MIRRPYSEPLLQKIYDLSCAQAQTASPQAPEFMALGQQIKAASRRAKQQGIDPRLVEQADEEGYHAGKAIVESRTRPRRNPQHARRNLMSREVLSDLTTLLDTLIATRWTHLTSHWRSSGPASFGDHLMYERLYKKVDEEIDDLAEQLVQLGGSQAVDSSAMLSDAARRISRVEEHMRPDPQARLASRALAMENALLHTLTAVRQQVQQADALSLGLDNLLAGIADTHGKHLYLLQQRLSSAV